MSKLKQGTGSFSITAGSAATITATAGGGQSANVSTAFTSPLVATVKDVDGNLVPGRRSGTLPVAGTVNVSATGTGDDILTFTPATGTRNLGSIDLGSNGRQQRLDRR